jgi:hypothetical protein
VLSNVAYAILSYARVLKCVTEKRAGHIDGMGRNEGLFQNFSRIIQNYAKPEIQHQESLVIWTCFRWLRVNVQIFLGRDKVALHSVPAFVNTPKDLDFHKTQPID